MKSCVSVPQETEENSRLLEDMTEPSAKELRKLRVGFRRQIRGDFWMWGYCADPCGRTILRCFSPV